MKRRSIALLILILLLLWPALAEPSRTFFAMDTVMSVSAHGADESLLDACEAEVFRLEALMSVTREESEIGRLNAGGQAALSEDTEAVLGFALGMCDLTGGALDVTLYPVVRAWGFTTGDFRVPSDQEIEELLTLVDWRKVELNDGTASVPDGTMVDLGALAKGYASDRLASVLCEGGVDSALINLGGNVCCLGTKPDGSDWRVGIQDPKDPQRFVGAVQVRDRAVITSGSYERYFTAEDGTVYGHIFDPATGRPADSGLISATVVGTSGIQCDALSTALYVMGVDRACALLSTLEGVDAVLVGEDGGLWVTDGLYDRFTPMDDYKRAKIHWIE